jgi:glycosyltransferase involved in cell wall biosynthesis
MQKLKIAILEEACAGGSGRHVADLASLLAKEGNEVHLLYSKTHVDDRFKSGLEDLIRYGGHAKPISMRHNAHFSDTKTVVEIRDYMRRHGRFDILHCHSTKAGLVGRLAALKLDLKVLYTPHAFFTMSPVCGVIPRLGAHLIEWSLSKVTDAVICVSEEEAEHARKLGIASSKLQVIPNGIPIQHASALRSQRAQVRSELGIGQDEVCIGSVGRLVRQKSPEILVEAFARAVPQLPRNVKLAMVGTGPLLQELQTIAEEFKVQEQIKFLGKLPGLRTMAAFDAFALTSCYEGHPYAFVEALSLGLPIVTTAVGGAKMSVKDGVNGFVCAVGDVHAVAKAVVSLGNSSELRMKMSRAALELAQHFTLEEMMTRTNQLYRANIPGAGAMTRAATASS